MNGIADPDAVLRCCYAAAVAAVQPGSAMRGPLGDVAPSGRPCWIISIGKASHGMAGALVDWLATHDRAPAGGIVVGAEAAAAPHPSLQSLVGDHPIPGAASDRAAQAIANVIASMPAEAEAHVAISGGASALISGPLAPLTMTDVRATFELLISSGLDIGEMNAVRKRVTRWSAGRLALALAPRPVRTWVISDVPGDDLGSIGSGPCNGDPWTAAAVQQLLTRHGLMKRLPASVQRALHTETAKPDEPMLDAVVARIVATNGMALTAAAAAARELGLEARVMPDPLRGDAAAMGRTIADALRGPASAPSVRIWGGETTVTIGGKSGTGGRCLELALAASNELQGTGGVLLAAGTDGRDGPTDAAGAVVTGSTWQRIVAAGRDPDADLRRHDSYAALGAAGALIRIGPTGTNVMDVAVGTTGWG